MKKILLILIFISFLISNAFAQGIDISKPKPKIEIYDLAGTHYSGNLYYFNDSTIYIQNSQDSSIIGFDATDIYRMDYYKKPNFRRTAMTTLGILEGINLVVDVTLVKEYFPGNILIGQIFVLPVSAIAGALSLTNKDDVELLIKGDAETFDEINFFLKKRHRIVKSDSNLLDKKIPQPTYNNKAIAKIPEIDTKKNKKTQYLFHFGIRAGFYFSSNKMFNSFKKNNFSLMPGYSRNKLNSFGYLKIGVRLTPHIRFFYKKQTKTYEWFSVEYSNEIPNIEEFSVHFNLDRKLNDFYFQYVFTPASKILTNRHEFSINCGVSTLKTWFNIHQQIYPLEQIIKQPDELFIFPFYFGFKTGIMYEFYFNRFFSLNLATDYYIFPQYKIETFYYEFTDGLEFNIDNLQYSFNGLSLKFGLNLHF